MMGWYGNGGWGLGGWLGMGLGMLLFWGLVVFVLLALLRPSSAGHRSGDAGSTHHDRDAAPPQPRTPTSLQILDERFARGEVSEDEYRRTREILQGR